MTHTSCICLYFSNLSSVHCSNQGLCRYEFTSGLSVNFFFATLARLCSILARDFCKISSDMSTMVTVCPVWAATWKHVEQDSLPLILRGNTDHPPPPLFIQTCWSCHPGLGGGGGMGGFTCPGGGGSSSVLGRGRVNSSCPGGGRGAGQHFLGLGEG